LEPTSPTPADRVVRRHFALRTRVHGTAGTGGEALFTDPADRYGLVDLLPTEVKVRGCVDIARPSPLSRTLIADERTSPHATRRPSMTNPRLNLRLSIQRVDRRHANTSGRDRPRMRRSCQAANLVVGGTRIATLTDPDGNTVGLTHRT